MNNVVLDFNGTLAVDGRLVDGVRKRLIALSRIVDVHVLTADTFGTATSQVRGLKCSLHKVSGANQDVQKEQFVRKIGARTTASIGNGQNDNRMLKASVFGICVIGREGASVQTLMAADVCVCDITDALDLLLKQDRLRATMRTS
ncbi:MAG: hypothetical protein QXP70_00645 [Methanomassiliicoccales archaeon]